VASGSTYGSSHGVYIFGGNRSNILVTGCTFRGIRKVGVKISGSSAPIFGVSVKNNYFIDCGVGVVVGADDSTEHSNIAIDGNHFIDCGTHRDGWTESMAIQVVGSRGVSIRNNLLAYTHNSIRGVDGSFNLAGLYAIQVARYITDRSAPIEDVVIEGNSIWADPSTSNPSYVLPYAMSIERVGLLQRKGVDSVVYVSTVPGDPVGTMILESNQGLFDQSLVGAPLQLVFCPVAANDVSTTITSVAANGLSLKYINALGTGTSGAPASIGTFRIGAPANRGGGFCRVVGNTIRFAAAIGVLCKHNVLPVIRDNVYQSCEVAVVFEGDMMPDLEENLQVGRTSDTPNVRFADGTATTPSFPTLAGNRSSNNAIGPTKGWGWSVGLDAGTVVDWPLCGKSGRVLPSMGREEAVIAWGVDHVDGDTVMVDSGGAATTWTYKGTVVNAATQFSTFAELIALINAKAGVGAVDYGTGFEDSTGAAASVITQHIRIRADAASTNTDGTLLVACTSLYPTALVTLTNTVSPNATVGGRGSESAGAAADRLWLPTQHAGFGSCPNLVADNADAQAVLVTDGFRPIFQVNGRDAGAGVLLAVGTQAGTEQYRWSV
jgi:hypothetical protein